ncbi:MAG: manganese efflux pump MntP family protein [Clostridiales bacterium]|nr:manganese efflux pump MntP family protein [Clostridiales bacterium]
MGYIEIFLIAVSLAMDAFAVSVTDGLALEKIKPKHGLVHGLYFGAFQFMMPLIGYLGANIFKGYIESIDHWIAFILLLIIGGNMIRETFTEDEEEANMEEKMFAPGHMIMLAVATSIDALAVGISFSLAELSMSIWIACLIIGCASFVLPFCGVYIGKFIGGMFRKYAARVGGCVLIIIGFKILFEHLGIFVI